MFARLSDELGADFFEILGSCTAEAVRVEGGGLEYRLNSSLIVYDAEEKDFAFVTVLFENQISFEHYILGTYSPYPLAVRVQTFLNGEEDSEATAEFYRPFACEPIWALRDRIA